MTHVLGVKASANDAAMVITESPMRVCGGADLSNNNFRSSGYFAVRGPER